MQLIRRFQYIKLVAADFGAALLAWMCFYLVRKYLLNELTGYRFTEGALFDLTGSAIFIAVFWTFLYTLVGEYRDIYRKSRLGEILRLARVSLLGAVVIFFTLLLDDQGVVNYKAYYKTFSAYYLLHFFITGFLRTIAVSSVQRTIRQGDISFPTLLVGSNALALNTFHELVRTSKHLGLRMVGFAPVGDTVDPELATELPARGSYQRLPALVRALKIEQIVIAIEPSEHLLIQDILTLLDGTPARVSILPDLYQMLLGSVKVNHLFGTPLIEIKQDLLPVWQVILKRVIDVVGSALFLLLASWVYAFTAIMVRLSSPGPIFYRQERIGRNGQPFRIIKFRSMFVDAEKAGPALSSDHDPRITKWGRFMRKVRLDELPQFWNVLKGDMSIVGPRPERQFFIDQIVKIAPHYRHLHRVRPGLTSLGQVKYGYAETVAQMVERLKFDILYIENMSLAMDFRVLLYTLKIIVEGRGK
ncbi:sugar transferase [Hymenobacter convexus]|uniref:sugar transferase n=1 Tax=Hymenobacter sp. CA1UV-4 TaxID=3063782 RepID=UPI0027130736|nr:sugar transferase [Hymenobacter sp. CA1UV-4]MDO7851781.1 sugar transferase [Hymenobacter sp. CA1UV-4]